MANPILPAVCDFNGKWRDFYMPQICDMGQTAYLDRAETGNGNNRNT
jgi:hypothetical protein